MNLSQLVLIAIVTLPQSSTEWRVEYGKSECAYCRMIIDHKGYGGELQATAGRVFVFDAIECIAASYATHHNAQASDVKAIRVVNYSKPGTLLPLAKATLARISSVHSPMGLNIIALPSRSSAMNMKKTKEDAILSWNECVEFVKNYWRLPPPKKK